MRLRFTIRDLLWLTALAAMGVGWWITAVSGRQEIDRQYHLFVKDWTQLKNEFERYKADHPDKP